MADQLTPFMLNAYESSPVITPNIDALAARGARFDAAYTPSPICVTARAAMMTGLYPSRLGCYDNGDSFPALTPTFAHHLTNAGYDTTLSGKMHFVGPDQLHGFRKRLTTDVYPSSYDWSYDPIDGGDELAFDFHQQYTDTTTYPGWSLELQFDEETHYRSLEYLRRVGDAPFAHVTSYTSPHPPFIAPTRFWDLYDGADIPLPDLPPDLDASYTWMDRALIRWYGLDRHNVCTEANMRTVRRGYFALISYLDHQLGELIAVLDEQGLRDKTAVLLVADHGEMLFEHGMVQKRSFREWSARIPMILDLPGGESADTSVHAPTSLVDVLPTLLDLAGVADLDLDTIDGRSVLPLLGARVTDAPVFSEYHAEGVFRSCFMVRQGQHKYLHIEGEAPALYDLSSDPEEWINLAGRPELEDVETRLSMLIFDNFDVASITPDVRRRLAQKKIVQAAMHRNQTSWDYQPFFDARHQYVRTDPKKSYVRT
jgi:choline-sulfatase